MTDFFAGLISLTNSLPYNLKEIAVALIIFSLFMVLRKVIIGYIFNLILKYSLKSNTMLDKDLLLAFVNFDRFNESSLDIFLYFFTVTTNWGEYLKVREDVNLKIMAILEEEKVSIAFPSRSVYFETPLTSREVQ